MPEGNINRKGFSLPVLWISRVSVSYNTKDEILFKGIFACLFPFTGMSCILFCLSEKDILWKL